MTRFEETPSQVRVLARNVSGGGEVEHTCERLFVACCQRPGWFSIPWAASMRLLCSRTVSIFYLPLLQSWWPRPDPTTEAAHTLTQLFIEILDPAVDSNTVHVQLYTYNDHYAVDMRKRLWRARRGLVAVD